MIFFTVLFAFTLPFSVFADDPIVQIKNGQIRGKIVTAKSGIEFYSFTEIPYAKPPLGELRFQPPQPAEDWDGILNCTESTRFCYNVGNSADSQTEDCLLLNVYSPVSSGLNASLPVMYHIYGGGFVSGWATFGGNGPHYFMEHDVVIVTVNYRIGPFGFLATGDMASPGNYGLKDQLLGLKWVQENIHAFGGDANKTTIFGLSAGGASTTYHVLSQQSTGLFRAAIAESGTALCPWAFQRDHLDLAYQLAKIIDPKFNQSSTTDELIKFLRATPALDLNLASTQVNPGYSDEILQGFKWAPVLEPKHDDAFITDGMYELVEAGNVNRVPMMLGLASEEMLSVAENGIDQLQQRMSIIDKNLSSFVQLDMHIQDPVALEDIGKQIREFYTDGLWEDEVIGSIKAWSDSCFARPILRHIDLHGQYADGYFYTFSYHGDLGGNNAYVEGAGRVKHGEYSNYLWAFGGNDNLMEYPESDITTSKRYVKMLVNFATHLNPTPEPDELLQNITWPLVIAGKFEYLDIDTNLTIQARPKYDIYIKWHSLYETRAVKPLDGY